MPKVTVKFFGEFSKIAGLKQIEINVPKEATLHDLLLLLKERLNEEIYKRVVNSEKMKIKRTIIVFINGRNTTSFNGLKNKIDDVSVVAFSPSWNRWIGIIQIKILTLVF